MALFGLGTASMGSILKNNKELQSARHERIDNLKQAYASAVHGSTGGFDKEVSEEVLAQIQAGIKTEAGREKRRMRRLSATLATLLLIAVAVIVVFILL